MTALSVALLSGCSDQDDRNAHQGHPVWADRPPLETGATETGTTAPPETGGFEGEASVRFVHLVDDLPALDVELAGVGRVVEGFGWGTASDAYVGYTTVPAGELDVRVSRTGGVGPPVVHAPLVLEPDSHVTVLLVGSERLGLLDPALGPRLRLLQDDAQPAPYPGAAIVTLLHAAPAWPALGVYAGPIPIASDLGFDEDTGALPSPAGPSVLGIDGDGDAVAEQQFAAEMPDGAWLYSYVVPRPDAPPPNVRMFIHMVGVPILSVDAGTPATGG